MGFRKTRIVAAVVASLLCACNEAAPEEGTGLSSGGTLATGGSSAGGMSGGAGGMTGGAAGAAGTVVSTGGVGGASTGGSGGTGGVGGVAGSTGGASGMASGGVGGMSATGGTGGMSASGGMGGASGSGMPTVTVELTTVSYDGEYAPLNYGAVWFEKADGGFIRTIKRWAGTTHASDLVAWTEASGGWGSIFGGGNMEDMVDAMSSATIRTHEMHTLTWNMKDVNMALVPDGDYVAVLEMSESRARDREGPLLRIPFTKGASPQTVEPPDQEGFTGVKLQYTP